MHSKSKRWSIHGVFAVVLALAAIWVLSIPESTPVTPPEDEDFPTVTPPPNVLWIQVLNNQTSRKPGLSKSDPNTTNPSAEVQTRPFDSILPALPSYTSGGAGTFGDPFMVPARQPATGPFELK